MAGVGDEEHDGSDPADSAREPGVEEGPVPSSPEPVVRLPGEEPQNDPEPAGVSADVIRTFLSQRETLRLVEKRVRRRIRNADAREELVQDALVRASTGKSPPANAEGLPGWLYTITDRTVVDHFRKRARRAKYEGQVEDIEELAGEPRDDGPMLGWLIAPWLERHVAGHALDEETLDILKDKAINHKTWAAVGEERECSVAALWGRIKRFKAKHKPARARYLRRLLIGGAVLLFAMLAVAAYVIGRVLAPAPPPAIRDETLRAPRVAPSASEAPPSVPTGTATATGTASQRGEVFMPATGPTGSSERKSGTKDPAEGGRGEK